MSAFLQAVDVPGSAAEATLKVTQYSLAPILCIVYTLANVLYGILSSESQDVLIVSTATGPGGRPLPLTKNKKKRRASIIGSRPKKAKFGVMTTRFFAAVSLIVVLTFFTNFICLTAHMLEGEKGGGWWSGDSMPVYLIGCTALHLYIFIRLVNRTLSPVYPLFWSIALIGELIILITNTLRVTGPHTVIQRVSPQVLGSKQGPDKWDYIDIGIASVRLGVIIVLLSLYVFLSMRQKINLREKVEHETRNPAPNTDETTPLLRGARATFGSDESNGHPDRRSPTSNHPGGTPDRGCQYQDEDAAFYRPQKLPDKTWWEYLRGYTLFFPYLWPGDSLRLKCVVVVCVGILIAQRFVNFMVPHQIGVVTDSLKIAALEGGGVPWLEMGLLIVFKMLQGQSGLLGSCRALLWIPVSQYSYRALTTAAFEHVHSLGLDFHLGKQTGEVLSALNKGASINSFLEQVTFQVFPMIIDLLVAIFYFLFVFGAIYATIAATIAFYYLAMTVELASSTTSLRRDMVNADREEEAVKNDSIVSYETVKYFNAEGYEFERYRGKIHKYQVAEAKVTWAMNKMNICQTLVFMFGMQVILMLAAYEVTQNQLSVGDFVVLITYLGQLQGPLNFFGTFYRTVQQAMVSGERLLELFKIQPSVVDRPGVPPLTTSDGHLRWNNVSFSYDQNRKALHNLTFDCAPGTTTAFVGESGGGKSTIFRLMFRYYACQEGNIEVDGCDVKDVTIDSVRRLIGVVPQDTILFNETLMYNLQYARPTATVQEIHDACRIASIHDRILSFTEGYDTKVGDRGLRLSGGEKQRVAIARTILKNPKIIMLDEATSALDSETEQEIQKRLIRGSDLGQNRTLLIIAHRLSTITHADQILVLHNGAIVERGTHAELLAKKGRYTSMWEKQSQAEEAAERARDATARANKLLRQAHIGVTGEDRSDGFNSMDSSTILHTAPPTPAGGSPTESDESSSDEDSHSGKGAKASD